MLTDEELKYWEQYGMAETVSMAREILATRATVIEQQAEIERLREAARNLLDNYGFCSDGSDHYREVPVEDIEALSAALGATQ